MRTTALWALLSLANVAVAQPPPVQTRSAPATTTTTAAQTAPGDRIRVDKDGFVLPAAEIDLDELIGATARYLQRNIICDPGELARASGPPLRLQKELALDALGCEEVVSQLLYVRGFALLAIDADRGLYEVVHLDGPRQNEVITAAPRRSVDEILRRPRLKMFVLTEVPLQHIDATVAANALRPFYGQASSRSGGRNANVVTFGTMGSPGSLLIAGFQDQVAHAIHLVHACDRPRADAAAAIEPRREPTGSSPARVAKQLPAVRDPEK